MFLKNIVFFVCICLIVIVLLCIIPSFIIRKNASFKIKGNTTSIIVGHSHSECSLNDSLLVDCENFSRSGESYLYTLCKVENIIKQNPNIQTVYVEVTNNQFVDGMKVWLYSERYLQFHYATFFPFISVKNHLSLFVHSPRTYVSSLPIVIKNMIKIILKQNYEFAYQYGGFKAVHNSMKENYEQSEQVEGLYEGNYAFLRQIVKVCKKNGVAICFFRSPQMPAYKGHYNEKMYKSLVANDYPEILYYDFDTLFTSPLLFSDYQHLNFCGAKEFSNIFRDSVLMKNKSCKIED